MLQLENVGAFLEGCKKYGMTEKDLFVTVDLVEQQNKNMVCTQYTQTSHDNNRLSNLHWHYSTL